MESDEPNYHNIHLETAQIAWQDLLRFFAQGVTLQVSNNLDLVEVALAFSNDDQDQVKIWLDAGLIQTVSDQQAKTWVDADAWVWSVVVRPWILVQENRPRSTQ